MNLNTFKLTFSIFFYEGYLGRALQGYKPLLWPPYNRINEQANVILVFILLIDLLFNLKLKLNLSACRFKVVLCLSIY